GDLVEDRLDLQVVVLLGQQDVLGGVVDQVGVVGALRVGARVHQRVLAEVREGARVQEGQATRAAQAGDDRREDAGGQVRDAQLPDVLGDGKRLGRAAGRHGDLVDGPGRLVRHEDLADGAGVEQRVVHADGVLGGVGERQHLDGLAGRAGVVDVDQLV